MYLKLTCVLPLYSKVVITTSYSLGMGCRSLDVSWLCISHTFPQDSSLMLWLIWTNHCFLLVAVDCHYGMSGIIVPQALVYVWQCESLLYLPRSCQSYFSLNRESWVMLLFLEIRVFNATCLISIFVGSIIMIFENWNTWVPREGDLAC